MQKDKIEEPNNDHDLAVAAVNVGIIGLGVFSYGIYDLCVAVEKDASWLFMGALFMSMGFCFWIGKMAKEYKDKYKD